MKIIVLISVKEEDDEILVQVLYCIHQLLLDDATCRILLSTHRKLNSSNSIDFVEYLLDLLYHPYDEIRRISDASLSIIAVCSRHF